ncbi:hypothetical protein [Nocardia nova]|uniref:hypothetical protein n=1 Tax=Nocardia nova TaxID=37330 RepID=UPI000687544F|nr:hypothetical protein [Nocardia nova]
MRITDTGRATVEAVRAGGRQHIRNALGGWSIEDLRQLAALNHRMVDDFLANAEHSDDPIVDPLLDWIVADLSTRPGFIGEVRPTYSALILQTLLFLRSRLDLTRTEPVDLALGRGDLIVRFGSLRYLAEIKREESDSSREHTERRNLEDGRAGVDCDSPASRCDHSPQGHGGRLPRKPAATVRVLQVAALTALHEST